jgi:hypothetical protein
MVGMIRDGWILISSFLRKRLALCCVSKAIKTELYEFVIDDICQRQIRFNNYKFNKCINYDLMQIILRHGFVRSFTLLLKENMITSWHVRTLIQYGHIPCLKVLILNDPKWKEKCDLSIAMEYEQLTCLEFLHQSGVPWNTNCSTIAGNFLCLKYAHEHGCEWTKATTEDACLTGKLDCLQYAVENGCPLDLDKCGELALQWDDLECLRYLRKLGYIWNYNSLLWALDGGGGNLTCVRYMLKVDPTLLLWMKSFRDYSLGYKHQNRETKGLFRLLIFQSRAKAEKTRVLEYRRKGKKNKCHEDVS